MALSVIIKNIAVFCTWSRCVWNKAVSSQKCELVYLSNSNGTNRFTNSSGLFTLNIFTQFRNSTNHGNLFRRDYIVYPEVFTVMHFTNRKSNSKAFICSLKQQHWSFDTNLGWMWILLVYRFLVSKPSQLNKIMNPGTKYNQAWSII